MKCFCRILAGVLLFVSGTAGAATFTVTNLNDSGAGSLSQAITDANNAAGDDTIIFDLPGSGPHVIGLSNPLPIINSSLSILNDRAGDEVITVRKNDSTVIQFEIFRVNSGLTVLMTGLTLSNGVGSSQGGGAVNNAGSTVTLRNCTLSTNQAFNSGGAIVNFGTGIPAKMTLINCTLNANTSGTEGGAIRNFSAGGSVSEVTLINCTLSGHTSGVIVNEKGAQTGTAKITVTNCTFANNRGVNSSKASSISNTGGTVEVTNSIFARSSTASPNFSVAGSVTFTSFGHNLSDDAAGGDSTTAPGGFLNATGDLRNTDPQLGPLANNGGLTATHALSITSPAVNAGDDTKAPQKDQRDFSRSGPSDIGSFEFIPGLVGNVSTRLPVGTGENVLIEGFSVQGPTGLTKKIIVRGIGPSLTPFGVTDALPDPTLEIHDSNNNNAIVARNDNWQTTQTGGIITADQSAEIGASAFKPGNNLESAIIANLASGSYTAVVAGSGTSNTGTAVVDAFDMSPASSAKLVNIATRGLVQPGDGLMTAGFIIQNAPAKIVVLAIGPSLTPFGITNALPDTTLQLRDQNGNLIIENDNWKVRSSDGSSQQAEMEATQLQPKNDLEAGFVTTIQPGQYTAQLRGKPEGTGIGVVQVYFLQ
jgi:hypothetical protein